MPNEDEISDEETTDPLVADARNFYKVQKWTRDGAKVDSLLYAGNSLGRARSVFERAIKHRPRIHVTIRQHTRVLDRYPPRPKPRFDNPRAPALYLGLRLVTPYQRYAQA